jgi:BMFP domain-containing protein YqiC
MMQTTNPLLDDLARLATGALGTLTGMRAEVEARLRDQFERVLSRMDLVTREEFEAVRTMASNARREQEILRQRLDELEMRLREMDAALALTARSAAAPDAGPGGREPG